ncbi:MAG: hypothetical protein J7518_04700 [Nocardioidaceae bacterium]|nr:hypothetical protein [Nocardioidaceae bacterium]
MVEGMATEARRLTHARNEAGYVPTPRTSPENASHSHRAPSLSELVSEAMQIVRRDDLPSSGFLVVQRKGSAIHQHAVWQLGSFALLDDGWFGQVHGLDATGGTPSRWLRRHERRCEAQHWTHFRWIDPASLEAGCGMAGIGLGLSPAGPTYCPGVANRDLEHPEHVPLAEILRAGLRALAQNKR